MLHSRGRCVCAAGPEEADPAGPPMCAGARTHAPETAHKCRKRAGRWLEWPQETHLKCRSGGENRDRAHFGATKNAIGPCGEPVSRCEWLTLTTGVNQRVASATGLRSKAIGEKVDAGRSYRAAALQVFSTSHLADQCSCGYFVGSLLYASFISRGRVSISLAIIFISSKSVEAVSVSSFMSSVPGCTAWLPMTRTMSSARCTF